MFEITSVESKKNNIINYFGIEFAIPKTKNIRYLATDMDGNIYGFYYIPTYSKETGSWDYPKNILNNMEKYFNTREYYIKVGDVKYNGNPEDSLKII